MTSISFWVSCWWCSPPLLELSPLTPGPVPPSRVLCTDVGLPSLSAVTPDASIHCATGERGNIRLQITADERTYSDAQQHRSSRAKTFLSFANLLSVSRSETQYQSCCANQRKLQKWVDTSLLPPLRTCTCDPTCKNFTTTLTHRRGRPFQC